VEGHRFQSGGRLDLFFRSKLVDLMIVNRQCKCMMLTSYSNWSSPRAEYHRGLRGQGVGQQEAGQEASARAAALVWRNVDLIQYSALGLLNAPSISYT